MSSNQTNLPSPGKIDSQSSSLRQPEVKYVKTFVIAPMTTRIKRYPTCAPVVFEGKKGSILLDQIRTIDQSRIIKKLGILDSKTASCVLVTLRKMFS